MPAIRAIKTVAIAGNIGFFVGSFLWCIQSPAVLAQPSHPADRRDAVLVETQVPDMQVCD